MRQIVFVLHARIYSDLNFGQHSDQPIVKATQWRVQDFPFVGWGVPSRWGGGVPTSDVGTFQQKHAKTKELDPIGGGGVRAGGVPPGSAKATIDYGAYCTNFLGESF